MLYIFSLYICTILRSIVQRGGKGKKELWKEKKNEQMRREGN